MHGEDMWGHMGWPEDRQSDKHDVKMNGILSQLETSMYYMIVIICSGFVNSVQIFSKVQIR